MNDSRNILDRYKGWTNDLIRKELDNNSLPFAVCMEHLQGDFNIGSVLRSANGLGAEKMFYLGKRQWDRRGAVGTQNYTNIKHINRDGLTELSKTYNLVALENVNGAVPITSFKWPKRPLILIGEEGAGLSQSLLDFSDYIVEIPMRGSVRSFNAAVAASIAMYDFVQKFKE